MASSRPGRRGDQPTARALAVRVLRDVERAGAFSNRALAEQLERWPSLDPRDRGLVTTLVYGVLRHRTRLDAHIDNVARKPSGLKGELRDILRVATYEIIELNREPAVAIAEANKLAKNMARNSGLASVMQALLSGVVREAGAFEASLEAARPLDVLDRRWSIPRWLAGRWLKQLGEDKALARARALADPPPVDLRIDLSRLTADEALARIQAEHPTARVELVADQPQAVRVRGGGDIFFGLLHDEGLISVQGLAAQQAVRMLAPQPGQRVLDACSGMGVKTLQLAEVMHRRGHIVAADADPDQLAALSSLRRRGRLDDGDLILDSITADLEDEVSELDGDLFDAVLLDVPCTGLGNLARHPEIRWHRRYDDIEARAQTQRTLLTRCLQRTKPGGRLAYAVCSFEPDEGPDIVAAELADADARLVQERMFTPESDGTEGFYVAVIERR